MEHPRGDRVTRTMERTKKDDGMVWCWVCMQLVPFEETIPVWVTTAAGRNVGTVCESHGVDEVDAREIAGRM